MNTSRHRPATLLTAGMAGVALFLAGCSAQDSGSSADSDDTVTVANCGEDMRFPQPATEIFVNESQMISMLFALEADDQITAVTGLSKGKTEMLSDVYGTERVEALPIRSDSYATMENILAAAPDAMMAGFGWGYSLKENVTPETLAGYDIPAYTSTPTCRQETEDLGGVMPPWEALVEDIGNVGAITGHPDRAQALLDDIDERRAALADAPAAQDPPTVFFFDLTGKEVMSAGSFSPAHAVIEAAGGHHALADLDADFSKVSWERITADDPDLIIVSDYGADSYDQKVQDLKTNPATRNLTAVQEERFLRLPIQMLLGTPDMIDSAEYLRVALEQWDLVPASDIAPAQTLD